jgi:ATP-binding cassette subfamily F protein 3
LLGPNGAGKSTLTKMLAGESPPLAGKRIARGGSCHRLLRATANGTAEARLRRLLACAQSGRTGLRVGDEQRVRDHLGKFGFQGRPGLRTRGRFSGGEKARLTLALLVARRPNLLLLDEPTNHLDIDMRQALTVALQSFEGGLVVVSHDRHLIKSVADTLWLVADGKLKVFDGDLDDSAMAESSRQDRAGGCREEQARQEAAPRLLKATAGRPARHLASRPPHRVPGGLH